MFETAGSNRFHLLKFGNMLQTCAGVRFLRFVGETSEKQAGRSTSLMVRSPSFLFGSKCFFWGQGNMAKMVFDSK